MNADFLAPPRFSHSTRRAQRRQHFEPIIGSTRLWVSDRAWELIVTMDHATSEHYSMFFVAEEGTKADCGGVHGVIDQRRLSSSFYRDRGSHCWHTPEADGKVDP